METSEKRPAFDLSRKEKKKKDQPLINFCCLSKFFEEFAKKTSFSMLI